MKQQFRLFRRGNVYYCEDCVTGHQHSLKTKDKPTALRLLAAKNEACRQPSLNLRMARIYFSASDPVAATRTWQHVMDQMAITKQGDTRARWQRGVKETPFDFIRDLTLFETVRSTENPRKSAGDRMA